MKKIKSILWTFYKGIRLAWREYHFLIPPAMWKKFFLVAVDKFKNGDKNLFYNPFIKDDYNNWILENCNETIVKKLKYNPLISIIIPVYNVDEKYLKECLDSVLSQSYKNFEICIADDCSTNLDTIITLKDYDKNHKNIKVLYRKENGHIVKASNSALSLAKGEYIALLDNDDILEKDALYEFVSLLNIDNKIDMIYSDEDKIDLNGKKCEPHFKPDWSPDTLMSLNYICHFTMLRKKIVDDIGGFRENTVGSQDYDLFLRFTEKTNNIKHIPKILYHWRMIQGSTSMDKKFKDYTYINGKKVLEDALVRRKINGVVKEDKNNTFYITEYKYDKEPLISIIIPTKDYASTLDICLKSIYEKTKYKNYEIIVVNNNSIEEETFNLFDSYKRLYKNFYVVDVNTEFNYSNINNIGVIKSKGDFIVLLNNDTEIITSEWLDIMVGYAMQPHIGAVGPKLFYPDNRIQHAGVVLGLGGVASHAYIGSTKYENGIFGRLNIPYNYSAVTAACLMIEKKKYLAVGGLNEKLKVAYNDIDLNIRLLKNNYYNLFVPQVELYHYESKSRGLDTTTEKYKRFLMESDYMYKTWDKEIANDIYYNPNFSKKGCFLLDRKQEKD